MRTFGLPRQSNLPAVTPFRLVIRTSNVHFQEKRAAVNDGNQPIKRTVPAGGAPVAENNPAVGVAVPVPGKEIDTSHQLPTHAGDFAVIKGYCLATRDAIRRGSKQFDHRRKQRQQCRGQQRLFWLRTPEPTSRRANEPTTSQRADEPTSQRADEPTSRRANEPTTSQ